MKKAKWLLAGMLVSFIVFVFIKSSQAQEKRNRLQFIDSLDEVQHNVFLLDSLIDCANARCHTDYSVYFKGDTLLVMNHKTDDNLKPGYFCASACIPIGDFKRVTSVLKRNYITSVYTDYGTGVKIYSYRDDFDSFTTVRDIIIDKGDNQQKILNSRHNPLDKKGRLLLVHPI